MSESIRPITVRSIFQEIACPECGAKILVNTEIARANDPEWNSPDNHEDDCGTPDPKPVIDTENPSAIKLTRLQAKILRVVRRHPGAIAPDIAASTGHRPRYVLEGLEALERLRWIKSDRSASGAYGWTWEALI